jgi:hypothetical protein
MRDGTRVALMCHVPCPVLSHFVRCDVSDVAEADTRHLRTQSHNSTMTGSADEDRWCSAQREGSASTYASTEQSLVAWEIGRHGHVGPTTI